MNQPSSASARLRADRHAVLLLGNPNTGKSALFAALTGSRPKIANFPGVTVEAKLGTLSLDNTDITLIDLPGTYSLAARSPDERVATEALLGRTESTPKPDGAILVIDAASLDRNLYLGTQVLEHDLPVVIALTMVDVAEARGITIDEQRLSKALGVPVVKVHGPKKLGIEKLKSVLHDTLHHPRTPLQLDYPQAFRDVVGELHAKLCDLGVKLGYTPTRPEAIRLLVDADGPFAEEVEAAGGEEFVAELTEFRKRAAEGRGLSMIEAQTRYDAISDWTRDTRQVESREGPTHTARIDSILTHKIWGSLVFLAVMALMFQAIYTWSAPMMEGIEGMFGALGDWIGRGMEDGPLKGLIVDGVIAGAGGVLVFLPQILILFLFIAILEDVGYMARAAFLMDRLMSRFGLTGRSFIPMLSSFACNIPGIMGARVVEERSSRIMTIMLAPFMSCSARLPIYTLMIGAFVPTEPWGLQALVLLLAYLLGIVMAIPTALLLKWFLRAKTAPFLMELPSYKVPQLSSVARVLWDRGFAFVRRAGTIILAVSIVVWALGYFPRDQRILDDHQDRREAADARYDSRLDLIAAAYDPALNATGLALDGEFDEARSALGALFRLHEETVAAAQEEHSADPEAMQSEIERAEIAQAAALNKMHRDLGTAFIAARDAHEARSDRQDRLAEIANSEAGELLRGSVLGTMGRFIEPMVTPLGWDWRIGMATVASFPAREVVIGTMGTIFNIGEADEGSVPLRKVLQDAKREDGSKLFTLGTALSVIVFFALCMQCAATLAVMRRETNSWKWPAISFVYMTGLAYVMALITFQVARLFGG